MKKRYFLLMTFALVGFILNGCSMKSTTDVETSQTESVVESEGSEVETAVTVELPDGFVQLTQEQAEAFPDGDGAVKVLVTALQSIGVNRIFDSYWGNYSPVGSIADVEAYLITDSHDLIARCMYLNNNWKVIYITDSENGHAYYPATAKNAYSYKTGELIARETEDSAVTEFTQEETTEPAVAESTQEETVEQEVQEVPHREGICGVSDKNCLDIDGTFAANSVRNDSTGKWRVSTISANVQMVEYAKSYYQWKFTGDDQIHCIVNFYNNTTTKIQYISGNLYVTVHDYVKGEEHDANLMFSGTVLQDYIVYLDNGDIEKLE